MESPIHIRQVQLGDLEEIIGIEQLNFSEDEVLGPEVLKAEIERIPDTFLIADLNGEIAGYVVGSAISSHHQPGETLPTRIENIEKTSIIALQRLSVNPNFKGQGIGTLLLAVMKEVTVAKRAWGICLACPDHLLSYFEMNGFRDEGILEDKSGKILSFEMLWENPYLRS